MARHDIHHKPGIIDQVIKKLTPITNPVIVPKDKYDAYAIQLKKAHEALHRQKKLNYILIILLTISITLNFTR